MLQDRRQIKEQLHFYTLAVFNLRIKLRKIPFEIAS